MKYLGYCEGVSKNAGRFLRAKVPVRLHAPRGGGGSPLFYISTSFTDCTTELYTDAPNSLLATLTQPQVQEPSTY